MGEINKSSVGDYGSLGRNERKAMILIEQVRLIDSRSRTDECLDILIKQNKIEKLGQGLWETLSAEEQQDCLKINGSGLTAAPGLVDVHVHFRDPGFTYKEDIFTGAKAAAAGGFTTVVLMANTKPVVDGEETLNYVLQKGTETEIHVKTCATVTKGMQGKELTDMESLKKAGACGFTDDGIPILDEELVREAMEQCADLKVPISFHEENPQWITNNGINQGKASEFFGIGGSPREAEISMVERDLKIALETGAIVNIQHISSKEAVELVRQAKKQSAAIHAEATPHHFTLTEEAVMEYKAMAKMNPPLREEEDRQAILQGLKDGTIDLIATDHAPHSGEEKAKEITQAPSGIIGLETAFALGVTNLVETGVLSLMQLIEKMSDNPAKMYGLDAGYIGQGGPADLILFDEKEEWTVREFASKSWNSPFIGKTLKGKIQYTICSGKVVYEA